jgi:hypothetical protein
LGTAGQRGRELDRFFIIGCGAGFELRPSPEPLPALFFVMNENLRYGFTNYLPGLILNHDPLISAS